MIADLIRDVGIAVLVVATAWWVRLIRQGGIIRHRRPDIQVAQIMPVPERQALPQRVPVAWQAPMYEELELVSPHLRMALHRVFLLLLEKHGGEWADEIRHELEVAQRQVVRGELAS